MKIERIMVPLDFSEHSRQATEYATELAREHEADVILVHVVAPLPYGTARFSDPTKMLARRAEIASVDLEHTSNEVQQRYPKCRSELHFGVVHEVIAELVAKLGIDLVVISTRKRNHPFDTLIGGGTAEKLLRYLPCAVLRTPTAP
jgi:universal stress protein A